MEELKVINSLISKIDEVDTFENLERIRLDLLGKHGLISTEFDKLMQLPVDQRKVIGAKINQLKNKAKGLIENKKQYLLKVSSDKQALHEFTDLTLPGRPKNCGGIHPISHAIAELMTIFNFFGLKVIEGPSIEDEWHNFTALNIPLYHPARQLHDTFYLNNSANTLLRTHTSPMQIRAMQNSKPPFNFVVPGRVYRCDYDATHTPMFHQIEGVVIDQKVNLSHMKFLLVSLLNEFFEQPVKIRLRPSFFPFTEPSAEVDIKIDEKSDWLEVLGCGMIHPVVLSNVNIDPAIWQGFAFGLGVERLAMLKYGIDDLRQLFEGDIRWLKHYSFSAFDIPTTIGGLVK